MSSVAYNRREFRESHTAPPPKHEEEKINMSPRPKKHFHKSMSSITPQRTDDYLPLPIDRWKDKPLLLCVHQSHSHYIHTPHDKDVHIPVNAVFPFESRAFKGKAIIRVKGTPTAQKWYFEGRARKMDITVQVEFT